MPRPSRPDARRRVARSELGRFIATARARRPANPAGRGAAHAGRFGRLTTTPRGARISTVAMSDTLKAATAARALPPSRIATPSGLSFTAILTPVPTTRPAAPAAIPLRAALTSGNGGEAVVEACHDHQNGHGRCEEGADGVAAARGALAAISDDDGGIYGVGARKDLAEAEDGRVVLVRGPLALLDDHAPRVRSHSAEAIRPIFRKAARRSRRET